MTAQRLLAKSWNESNGLAQPSVYLGEHLRDVHTAALRHQFTGQAGQLALCPAALHGGDAVEHMHQVPAARVGTAVFLTHADRRIAAARMLTRSMAGRNRYTSRTRSENVPLR